LFESLAGPSRLRPAGAGYGGAALNVSLRLSVSATIDGGGHGQLFEGSQAGHLEALLHAAYAGMDGAKRRAVTRSRNRGLPPPNDRIPVILT
jgi:hypothetical protein